jgi:beta-glucosidase-like glycosyl hydrolase
MKFSSQVDQLLGRMTLDEKVGQVFVFTCVSMAQAIEELSFSPGGFIRIQCDALTAAKQHRELQLRSAIPLLFAADFERGVGNRFPGGTDFCSMMTLGAAGSEELAYSMGQAIAAESRAVGVQLSYVPVLDVNINEHNPIINTRSFGADPELVARLGSALIRGHRDGGVLTCAKHFPGHGDTEIDSHSTLGQVNADRARLEAVELLPFRAAIKAGVDCVMSAHLMVPSIEPDPIPATLSPKILQGLLREEMEFQGVITTDALDMGAITRHFSPDEAIIGAFSAGCDMLIMPLEAWRAVTILQGAVKSGQISEARLDEAVLRILGMKEKAGILDSPPVDPAGVATALMPYEHQELARKIARSGITLVQNTSSLLPLQPRQSVAVLSFSNYENSHSYYMEPASFGAHLKRVHDGSVQWVHCGKLQEEHPHEFHWKERALHAAAQSDVIIVAAYVKVIINSGTVSLDERSLQFMASLRRIGKPIGLVSFGSPYLVKQVPWVDSFVCAYSATESCQEVAAELLVGRSPFQGRLPVTVTMGG